MEILGSDHLTVFAAFFAIRLAFILPGALTGGIIGRVKRGARGFIAGAIAGGITGFILDIGLFFLASSLLHCRSFQASEESMDILFTLHTVRFFWLFLCLGVLGGILGGTLTLALLDYFEKHSRKNGQRGLKG